MVLIGRLMKYGTGAIIDNLKLAARWQHSRFGKFENSKNEIHFPDENQTRLTVGWSWNIR